MGRRYLVFECILTSVIAALVFWGGRRPLARSVLVVERGDEDAPLTASIIADGKIIEVDATEALDQLNTESDN